MVSKWFAYFFLLLFSISLFGCSSNTQDENTGLGALTGAIVGGLVGSAFGSGTGEAVAIGAGAVAGALIGGAIGNNMDSIDNAQISTIMETNPTYKSSTWTNSNTGVCHTLIPMSNKIKVKGNPNCRKFRSIAVVNGRKQHIYGTACKEDGEWKRVDTVKESAPVGEG